jgi:UDP-N-acetylmuramate dehydrogenase
MNVKEMKDLKIGDVLENVSLKNYTTYHLETITRFLVFPRTIADLKTILSYLKERNIPHKILGGGSNLIFKNSVYEGVLIHLKYFNKLEIIENQVKVGAGYSLMRLSLKTVGLGLSGLEFASGIPGTLGGAIFNNAGAYQSDIGYVLLEATVLTPSLEVMTLKNRQMDFHYRTSFFKENPGYVVLEGKFLLKPSKSTLLYEIVEDRKKRRMESQPLELPSAGSVFRNPKDMPAWQVVEKLGYKGFSIGGAMVSEKHANFIVNKKGATGKDIVALIQKIQKDAFEKLNINLVLEQEIVE